MVAPRVPPARRHDARLLARASPRPHPRAGGGAPPETLGLRVRRGDKPDTQVSNAFARRYFAGATRHVVRLDDDDAIYAYFTAGDLSAPASEGEGYYLVLGRGGVLGRARAHHGALRGEPSKNERTPPVM